MNLAGLALGAAWLGSQTQWQVIWVGVVMMFFSPYIIPILVIPAGIFSHFMIAFRSAQRPDKEKTMFFLSLAYLTLFLTAWCAGVFEYVTHSVALRAIGAGLLWSCTTAMAPLLWWSSRDRSNTFVMTMVEVAQCAMIILSIVRLLCGDIPFELSFAVLGGIIGSATAAQAVYEDKFINKNKEMAK